MLGPDYPIRRDEQDGFFASTDVAVEQLRVSVLNLLSTQRGERLMRPNFGTGLRELLFRPSSGDLATQIREQVKAAIESYVPYVTVENVDVRREGDLAAVLVSMSTEFSSDTIDVGVPFQQ